MFHKKIPMSHVLCRIESANDQEVQQIMSALIHWQEQHYPEDELIFLSLPKRDIPERCRNVDIMAEMLKKYVG